MCVISIKVPIRKKSGNLFNDPGMFVYLYCCMNRYGMIQMNIHMDTYLL